MTSERSTPSAKGPDHALAFRSAVIPEPRERSVWRDALWTLRVWILLALSLVVWEAACRVFDIATYLLPPPSAVLNEFLEQPAFFLEAFLVTTLESLGGFALAAVVGIAIAIAMARSLILEEFIFPYLNILRVMPVIAIAPLLIIWFGRGFTPMIIVAALIAFFPIVVNALLGLRSVEPDLIKLMHSLNASERTIFWKVRLPNALPHIMSAFRISAPGAVIGALVGEFVGGTRGLGFLLVAAQARLDTAEVFLMVVLSSIVGVGAFGLVVAVERRVLAWHPSTDLRL